MWPKMLQSGLVIFFFILTWLLRWRQCHRKLVRSLCLQVTSTLPVSKVKKPTPAAQPLLISKKRAQSRARAFTFDFQVGRETKKLPRCVFSFAKITIREAWNVTGRRRSRCGGADSWRRVVMMASCSPQLALWTNLRNSERNVLARQKSMARENDLNPLVVEFQRYLNSG